MKALFTLPFILFACFYAAAQAPLNDDCAGIIDLGEIPYCSGPGAFTNVNATTSLIDATNNVPACWNNLANRDVWFQFNLPADGSITDISIRVLGNIAGNGTLNMPELAVYRGDCVFGGLAELGCVAAPLNVNEVHLDLFGLTPGVPYFLRINDYSATASANAGSFKVCVETYVPDLNMGDAPGTASCSGTLWDSGGPDGDYNSDENLSFVICPSEFHQCIILDFISYATEFDYDMIQIHEGDDTGGTLLKTLDGPGDNFQLQVSSPCVTIEFSSDGSIEEAGFELHWQCSSEVCDAPPPVLPSNATCDQALNINGCANESLQIPLTPGQGDPGFIQDGVNAGCFFVPSPGLDFSFFYFEAQTDGNFGFLVRNADLGNPVDIDFSVWGPIDNVADICDFTSNNQPVRSSWAYAPEPENPDGLTGLVDVHPVSGLPVTDEFDCGSTNTPGEGILASDDSFVKTLQVQQGKFYVVLLDNFDGVIEDEGIAIDFSGTANGVLGPENPAITVTNDTFSCDGSPIQLQVIGGIGYAWTPSTGLSCNNCPNPFASPGHTMTYAVNVLEVCQSLMDSVTIAVGPVVHVQADTAICNGQTVLLGHTVPEPGVNYSWSPNDGSLSDPNGANPVASPLQTTIYTLTASSGPCIATRVVTVAVVQLDLLVSVQDTAICRGTSVQISAQTNPSGIAINWSPLTQLQVQPGGMQALSTPLSSIMYQVSATLPGCVRKETVSILVDSIPLKLALSPSDTMICGGEQVLLVSPSYSAQHFPNLQFSWQTGTGEVLPENAYFLLVQPLETTTYQRITSQGVCRDTANSTVRVTPIPVLNITPASAQLCAGENTTLFVDNTAGLNNFNWTPPEGLSCITCNNTIATPAISTTYVFTADVANGCKATASVLVEVNAPPQFQFPNDTLCAGEDIVLNLIDDPTVTYTWTSIPSGFFSTEAQPVDTPAQTTTYLVKLENGCTLQEQFKVQVVPQGSLMVSENDTICAGVSTQLTVAGNYPGTYTWSNGSSSQVINAAPTQSTTYYITYAYPLPNPQCQLLDSVHIEVQGGVAQVQFPLDTLLCPGDSVLLNSIATPGATYAWSSNPAVFSSSDSIPPVLYPEQSAIYTVMTTLGNCSATYSVEITVFNPQMVVSEDTTICAGETISIGADAFLTGDYLWTPGGTTPTFVDTLTASQTYTLRFEYGDACIFKDTVQVTVIPNFTLKLISDPDTNQVDVGVPIMLDAFVPGTNVNSFSFEWLENHLDLVGTTQQITVTPVTADSTVTYFVTVVSPSGCIQTGSLTFTVVHPNIKVPNAFTPNGDGSNDGFGLAIIEGVATIEKMEVYSRWGQKVFASNEPTARWDGTISGKDAPSDVYVYIIFYRDGDGALQVAKGEVSLLR